MRITQHEIEGYRNKRREPSLAITLATLCKATATHWDFVCNFLWTIPQRMMACFFGHRIHAVIYSTRLCWWFGGGLKIKLINIHFLSWIPFFHAEHECSSIWSWLFYSQHLHTSLWFYVDKLSVLRRNVRRKNHNGALGRSSIYFNAIRFLCGIVHYYLWEKIATCRPSLWFLFPLYLSCFSL